MSARAHPFILVAGGCRSGKSAFAQHLLETLVPNRIYAATAEVRDPDMARRVAAHQAVRGQGWQTLEVPLGRLPEPAELAELAKSARPAEQTEPAQPAGTAAFLPKNCGLLFDCLSVWVAGRMETEPRGEDAVVGDIRACLDRLYALPCPVVVVSSETGLGLVPASKEARDFRDLCGLAGQEAARTADTVIFMLCGLPLVLKGKPPAGITAASSPFHSGESLHAFGQTR